jgi:hypothetical protein
LTEISSLPVFFMSLWISWRNIMVLFLYAVQHYIVGACSPLYCALF